MPSAGASARCSHPGDPADRASRSCGGVRGRVPASAACSGARGMPPRRRACANTAASVSVGRSSSRAASLAIVDHLREDPLVADPAGRAPVLPGSSACCRSRRRCPRRRRSRVASAALSVLRSAGPAAVDEDDVAGRKRARARQLPRERRARIDLVPAALQRSAAGRRRGSWRPTVRLVDRSEAHRPSLAARGGGRNGRAVPVGLAAGWAKGMVLERPAVERAVVVRVSRRAETVGGQGVSADQVRGRSGRRWRGSRARGGR